jgi:hypothetical protein
LYLSSVSTKVITWARQKWARIGVGESLSYAGINFHKPIDEEQLVKEIKIKKKLNSFSAIKVWAGMIKLMLVLFE